jgi:hypothetical protein
MVAPVFTIFMVFLEEESGLAGAGT